MMWFGHYTLLFCQLGTLSAEKILKELSLDEKIGQLFMIPARTNSSLSNNLCRNWHHMHQDYVDYLIKEYGAGGVLYLDKHTIQEQIALTQRFQTSTKIPLLIGQDFEWGLGMRLTDGISCPRAAKLGTLDNSELTYKIGYEIGKQCRILGVHINFAPVVDINTNPANPIIGTRSFGDTPDSVIKHATAFAKGLLDNGILPCIKHFPGHGDTNLDSHWDLPLISHTKERLEAIELVPFKTLIQQGIPAVMVAHLNVPCLEKNRIPSSLSRAIVTDLLRNTYSFNGLIITDALDMGALNNYESPSYMTLEAFKAGHDILLGPSDVPGAHALIKQAVTENDALLKELDMHVLRILKAKEWLFTIQHHATIPQYCEHDLHSLSDSNTFEKMLSTNC